MSREFSQSWATLINGWRVILETCQVNVSLWLCSFEHATRAELLIGLAWRCLLSVLVHTLATTKWIAAVVEDPAQDWDDGGMTFRAFEFSKPGLRGGLSSRVICGESGPMHLQTDPMSQVS